MYHQEVLVTPKAWISQVMKRYQTHTPRIFFISWFFNLTIFLMFIHLVILSKGCWNCVPFAYLCCPCFSANIMLVARGYVRGHYSETNRRIGFHVFPGYIRAYRHALLPQNLDHFWSHFLMPRRRLPARGSLPITHKEHHARYSEMLRILELHV